MGKSLNGKELGTGISQRKDGLYQGRFTDRFGNRKTIYNAKLSELRKQMREVQYVDDKKKNVARSDMTLDEWFDVWMQTYKQDCRIGTKQAYEIGYQRVRESLGWRKLSTLNLTILQQAINEIPTVRSRQYTKERLVDILDKAVASDLMTQNIARKITIKKDKEKKERRVLTVQEEKTFLEVSKQSFYHNLYVVALQTGMRIGELRGLQWEDVDFENRIVHVRHTLFTTYSQEISGRHILNSPKTHTGKRTIPLTQIAFDALQAQKIQKDLIIQQGHQPLPGFENLVFISTVNRPLWMENIQRDISKLTRKMSCAPFSTHTFRHTFATRAIERGMNPKTLQKILGHSTLSMTMDLYCHVTDDTLVTEMEKFERNGVEV